MLYEKDYKDQCDETEDDKTFMDFKICERNIAFHQKHCSSAVVVVVCSSAE